LIEITSQQSNAILLAGSRVGYQTCVIVASLLGGVLIRKDSMQWSVSPWQRGWIMLAAFAGAMLGCAIPAYYAGGLVGNMAGSALPGPKTVLGGILGAFLFVSLFKRVTRNHADTSDAFARGAIAMMAVGRIGCILQHCCYGKPAVWGMDFGDGVPRVPVQYMEALGLFAIFGLIWVLHLRNVWQGRRLFIIFTLYGALRFGLEFWREQVATVYGGIGFYQWLALVVMLVGMLQLTKRTYFLLHPRMPDHD
jgi:phosphatidylglycerol:prolipoprotein diacylglycerol transferase